jgi:hypothetical protein
MTFIVSTGVNGDALVIPRGTATGAVEKAMALIGQGSSPVTITDPNGRSFASSQFDNLLATWGDTDVSGS